MFEWNPNGCVCVDPNPIACHARRNRIAWDGARTGDEDECECACHAPDHDDSAAAEPEDG